MATVKMQEQLAMLRMSIDRAEPVHVEAEAAFAAVDPEVMRAEIADTGNVRPDKAFSGHAGPPWPIDPPQTRKCPQ